MTKSGETLPLAPKIDVSYISKIVIVVTFLALFLWSWIKIDMSIFEFFSDFQNVINLFRRMYPQVSKKSDKPLLMDNYQKLG